MSEFKIRVVGPQMQCTWDNALQSSLNGSPFHYYGWLEAIARESRTELVPLMCEGAGDLPVGLFPVFIQKKGWLKILHSPPPRCGVPALGPVFFDGKKRQNRVESERRSVVTAFVMFIENEMSPDFFRCLTLPEVGDIREFQWQGFQASPLYTYRMDIERNSDTIFREFDPRIRQRIRKAEKYEGIKPVNSGIESIKEFRNALAKRYVDQGIRFKLSERYLLELIRVLGNDVLRYRAFYSGDTLITGVLFIKYQNQWLDWLGGFKPLACFDGIVEVLHWNGIKEAQSAGCNLFERIGGNTRHLCTSKAKYNLRPVLYFELIKGGSVGSSAYKLYTWWHERGRNNKEQFD